MRRRYTAIERAHLLAVSTLIDPRMKKKRLHDKQNNGSFRRPEIQLKQKPLLLVHKMIIQKAVMSKVHPVCGIFLIKRS